MSDKITTRIMPQRVVCHDRIRLRGFKHDRGFVRRGAPENGTAIKYFLQGALSQEATICVIINKEKCEGMRHEFGITVHVSRKESSESVTFEEGWSRC